MTHLFLCREYPPAAYPPGGIGTYVRHVTGLLARAGETVHVIAHRWDGAPSPREELAGGRLVLHRVGLDEASPDRWAAGERHIEPLVPAGLLASTFPSQAFSWQAALLAERLIEDDGIDVIEAQEWEAPLYYLQLRRALGLGPARRPPCVVHIHSPSERIFAANGWDTTVADYAPAAALEAYSITMADAVLCPSRFVADEVRNRYAVDASRVTVIPYPRGDAPLVDRGERIWSSGSICHVGRLEPRKGVLEWAEAITMIAADHPDVHFDFVGSDTPMAVTGGPTVGQSMLARVPRPVRRQLHFHGSRDRAGMHQVLSTACAAVVPSRWENFPYSCIESMSSGLPVIASPTGGMRELIVDGASGWIALDGTPAGLAHALRRALSTSGPERQRMGAVAAATVRRVCDNEAIVGRHLELKAHLVRQGASPARIAGAAGEDVRSRPDTPAGTRRGMAVVVACSSGPGGLDRCLSSIRAQAAPPVAVYLVCDAREALSAIGATPGWHVVERGARTMEAAVIHAVAEVASDHGSLLGVAVAESRVQLSPTFLSICETAFARDARVGVLGGWMRESRPHDRIAVPPCPEVPYAWHDDETTPLLAVRLEAFEAAHARSRLEALTAVVRQGWTAVTYPGVVGALIPGVGRPEGRRRALRYSSMARAAQRLHTPLVQWLLACSPEDRWALVRAGLAHPGRSVRWFTRRAVRALRIPMWQTAPVLGRDGNGDLSNAARRSK